MPAASKALRRWREANSGEWADGVRQVTREYEDITDGQLLNWKGFLARHPDGQRIVGDGVTSVEFRFVAAIDKEYSQRRCDIVVHRVGPVAEGRCVRLHPHQQVLRSSGKKEAEPLYGELAEWMGAPPDEAPGGGSFSTAASSSTPQQDYISRADVRGWLRHLHDTAWDENAQRWHECLETTSGEPFQWWRWLASSPNLRPLAEASVSRVWACWHQKKKQFVIVILVAAGSYYTIIPGPTLEILDGCDDVSWREG